jgi:uncharacterized phage infection (PIP) family protein YhgE
MEPFYTIRFKRKIALQFKQFSKRIAKTHTQALQAMLDFFQWHGISPLDRFGPQLQREEEKTRKRIDAVIAIIKDIEKHQTKPTTAMLQALFAGLDPINEKPISKTREKLQPKSVKTLPENTISQIKYDRLKEERDEYQQALSDLLSKVTPIKPAFGNAYFKLEISPGELVKIERKLQL